MAALKGQMQVEELIRKHSDSARSSTKRGYLTQIRNKARTPRYGLQCSDGESESDGEG